MMVSMDCTTPCTTPLVPRVSAGTLIQAAAYTAFNEHDHINVSNQFKIDMRMF